MILAGLKARHGVGAVGLGRDPAHGAGVGLGRDDFCSAGAVPCRVECACAKAGVATVSAADRDDGNAGRKPTLVGILHFALSPDRVVTGYTVASAI